MVDSLRAASPARDRLVVASNRGPVSFRQGDGGALIARRGGGGLVTALGGLAHHHDVTWIAHAMTDGDVAAMGIAEHDAAASRTTALAEVSRDGHPYRLRFVGRPDDAYDAYYNAIANPLLWFVQHRLWAFGSAPTITRGTHAAWRSYRAVNERFATALAEEITTPEPGSTIDEIDAPTILVQDYHLFLVPGMLRARGITTPVQYFQHVPWPDPGAWRCLPREWVEEILTSLLSCDVIGLQTPRDAEALLDACARFAGAVVDRAARTVTYDGRLTRIRDYPISVAVDEFEEHVQRQSVKRLRERVRALRPADGTLIVRVDRTDPSKNIVRGFMAYELMLREHPELHGRVTMFCQLDPSRQGIPEYVRYLADIMRAVEQVNDRFGTGSWQPVVLNPDADFAAAVAAYTEYDVLFVNPVADGMNLVSKEGPLVNDHDGVVVLSEQAGSCRELGEHVLVINPFDVAGQADALHTAITMDLGERRSRAEALREQVRTHDVTLWIDNQLEDLAAVRHHDPAELQPSATDE